MITDTAGEEKMSEEMKNTNAQVGAQENAPSIAEKLVSAAETLNSADEEAKARRDEELKKQEAEAKEEEARRAQEEIQRREAEEKNAAYLKKKQAEMEYAENYRRKLREEKEKARALAAKRKANKLKAEAEAKAKADAEAARQEASREHVEEANRRNDEADQYVDKVEAKHEENEKALEELKTAREEAKAKRDADRAAAMQRKAENESKKDEPITLTEDAIELFPENDKSDDNKTEDQKADKPAESFVLSFDENGDLRENAPEVTAPKAEEKAAPEGTLVVDFDDLNNAMNAPKAAPAAPKAEAAPKAAPKAAPAPAAPAGPSPLSAYLRDRSTLGSVTKPTDFGKDYEEKKKNAKAVLGKVKPDSGSMPNIKLPSKSTGGYEGAGALSAVNAPEKASNRKSKKTKNGVAGGEDDESNLDPSLGAVGYGDAAGNDTAAGKPEGESAAIEKEFDPAAQSGDEGTTVNKGENAGDNTSLAPENNENIPSAEAKTQANGENSPKKAEAMPEGEGAAAVTALAMSKTDLKRYLDRADFFEQGLIAKEKILREKQTTYHGEISAILLRDCMDTERELLASYIDDLRRCVDSSDTKNAGYYLKKTRALVDGYNVDINNWNALTGDELKPLPESFINDSMASNDKPSLPVAELPEEVIAKYPFANDGRDENEARKAAAAKDDIGLSLGATSLSPVEEAMSRRMNTNLAEMKACAAIILLKGRNAPEGEIRRYLKGIHSYEKKLNAYEKVARYNQQRFYGESAVIHLKECLDIERALLGVYTEAYKCGKAMGDANMAKKYHAKASRTVDNYNIDLALWGNLTGTKPDMILDNFVDTVDSGAPIVIPCVTLPENITKVLSARDASYQRRIADAERQKVLAARASAAAAKASAEGANAASPDGNTIPKGAEDTAKKNKNVRSAKQAAKLAKAAKAGKAEKIAKSIEVANASEATKATKAGKKAAKATKANAFGKYDPKNLNIYEPFLVANTPKTNKLLKELMAYDASVAEMAVLPEDEMRFYNDLEMYQDVMKFNYDEDKLFTEYDNREIMADLNKALERNASFSDNDELMKDYDRFLSKHSKGKKTESFGYNEEAEMAAADTVSRKAEPNIYLADERRALRSSFNNIAYKKGEVKEGAYRKYLKNAKKYDAELIELERAEKAATVKNKKDKDALRKKINIENQLIESYSSTLVYATEAKDAVAVSKYERKLAAQVEKYNDDLKKYSKLTGEKITPLTVEYAVKTASAGDADSAQYDKYLKRNALNEEGKRQKKQKKQNELAIYENAAKNKKSRKSDDYGYEYSSRRSYADYDEYSRIAGEDEYKNSKNQLKEEKYLNDYEKYLAGKSAKKQGGSGKNYSAAYEYALANRESGKTKRRRTADVSAYSNYDEAMALRGESYGKRAKAINTGAYEEEMALRATSVGKTKGINGNAYDEAMALREASAGIGTKGVNGNAYDEAMALREASAGIGTKGVNGNAYDEAMALREASAGLGIKGVNGNAYDEAMALREASAGIGTKGVNGNAYDEAMALREAASGKKAFSAGGYDEAMALREAANGLGGKAIDGNAYDEAMALREAASGKKAFSAGGYDEAMALREAAAGLGMKGVDTLAYEEEMAMREIALGKKAKGSAQSYDEAMALREAASTLGIKGLDTDAYDEAMALREAASGKKAFSAGGYDEAMALREASAALSGKGVDTYAYDEAMALGYEGKNYKKSSNYLARYEAAKALDEIRSNYSKPGNAVAHYEAAMALREVQGGYSKPSNSLARYEEAMALDEIRTSYSAADNSLSRYEANLALDEIRGSYTKKDNYISAYDEMMAGREVTEYAPARSVSDEAYAAMLAGLTAGKAAKKRGAALNNEIALYEAHIAKKQVKNAGGKDYSSSAALYDSYLAEAENAAAYTKGSTSLERYEDMLRRRADGRAVAEANRESRVYRSESELDRRNYGYNYIEERKRSAKGDESYIYDYEMSRDIKARRASSSKATELQAYENMLEDRIAKRRRNAQYDASERKSKRENIDRLIAGYERLNSEILNRQAYEELSVIDAYEAALAEKESKKTDKKDMANDLRRFDANFVYGYSDIDIYSSDKYQNSFDSSLYGVIREPVNASNIDSFIARYEAAITAKRNSGAASASSGMYDYISNKRGGVSSFAYEEQTVNEAKDINEYVAKEAIAISEQSPNMFDRYDERAEAKYDAKHKREEKMIARYADAREEKLLRRRDGINTELEIFEERMAKRADLDPKNYDKIIAGYDNKLGNKKVKNKQAKAADAVALYEKKLSKKLGKPVAKKALSSDLITVSALEISAGEAKYFGDRALRRFIAGEAKKNGKLEATEAIAYAEVFSGSKTDNLAAISECLDAERDLIESYAKVYRAAASSENEKYSQIYLAKLTSMVDKYNSNLELAKTLSGLAVPTLPSDFKARLAKGEGVLIPTVIKNENTATAVAHTTAPASRSEVREDMAMALARHETDKLIGAYAMEMEKELGKTLYSDEYNDITEKDIKTVSNAGALASFEAVRLLDKRELKKYLKRSAKYEKSIVSDIKDSRTRNRHSRDEYAPLYLKECLESEAKLIESLSCDYKLAYALSDDKSIKKYEKKLKRLIAEYNIDLTEFGIVTKTAQSRIPSNSVNELRRGGVIDTPMNMPDKLLPQLGDPNSNKVYSKQLAALEGKLQDKTVEKIELNKALKSYSKMDITDKTVKDYEEYLIKSGKYTEFADVTDKIGAYSENSTHLMTKSGSKYARREEMMRVDRRAREDALTAKYEKSIEALDITPDKKGKKNLANIYDDTMASKAYIKEQEKFFNATDLTDLNEQTAELVRTLEEGRDNDAKRALEKRDLKRYLARKRRIEKRLKQRQSAARHNYFNSTKGEAKKYLREVLGYDKALLESYVDDYETVLTVRNNHKIKEYKRLVDLGVRSYDADLGVWCGLTGEAVPKISKTLSDDIRNGEKIQPIRAIDPEDKTKPTKKQVNKNLQAFLDEEKKRERRAAIREKELTTLDGMKDGNTLCITKEHMKTDVDTVAAKIEYRKERLSNHVAEHRYRFGLDSDKQRRKMIRELAKLRKMRKLARPTLNIEKRNNKRYLEIAALDPIKMTAKIHSAVKKERAEELLNRIKSLLIERDEVNMRLLALYSDENGVKTNKRKSKRRKIAKIRLKASKKAFKKQWKLYRKAKKYRVSDKQKQRIFDAMNKKVEYRAYIAELKYRKRHEKAKGKPKHIILKELRETKMRLRYANRDFDRAMTKASRRSRRIPSSKRQIIWGVASVIIVLCCVIGVKILLDNSDKLMGYLRLLLVKLKGVLEARAGQ